MSRPWMPLYVADYLADTAHLGATESGAYLHLIFHYWKTGGLPDDHKQLATIAKVSSHSWKKLCPTIQKFFHDGWKHKRIDDELAKACEISVKRSDAAKARYAREAANASANAELKQTPSQSQSQEKKEPPSLRSGGLALETVSRETTKRQRKERPAPISEHWKPPDRSFEIAAELKQDVAEIEGQFRDYLKSTGKQYIDYDAAFCNFVRNAPKFNRSNGNGPGRPRPLQDDSLSVSRALDRQRESGISFAPRPRLLPDDGQGDLRLLPKG